MQTDLAQCWTNGKGSNKVMLGSSFDGVYYYKVAENGGTYKYFYNRDYTQFKTIYGNDFVFNVNFRFLDIALEQNCEFYTSHLPSPNYPNSALYKEYIYLQQKTGCTITFQQTTESGYTIWKLIFGN